METIAYLSDTTSWNFLTFPGFAKNFYHLLNFHNEYSTLFDFETSIEMN